MQSLIQSLAVADAQPITLGDKILVLPLGARVIGLFPDEVNVLWTNPVLETDARAYLSSDEWINSGGDRTWISPEYETNVGDTARFWESYSVPKAMDPARYEIVDVDKNRVTLATPMNLHFGYSDCDVELRLTKTIEALDAPFALSDSVQFAGYRTSVALQAQEVPGGALPAIWNILQVRGGGEILVPSRNARGIRAFIAQPETRTENGVISCEVETTLSYKFGVHVADSSGLLLHHRVEGDRATLVARRFQVFPDAIYGDAPGDDLSATGFSVQVYVDDGTFGGFGEMEHQSPALQNGAVADVSETWSFSGDANAIVDLRNKLLHI